MDFIEKGGIMVKEGQVILKEKEFRRIRVLDRVELGEIRVKEASEILGISRRQVSRLLRRYRREGWRGVVHRARGRPSHRRLKDREEILRLYKEKYGDFGPTLASEKLLEIDGIRVSRETLRKWLLDEDGEYEWRRRRRPHRKWRERKGCFGEMVQIDGSEHDWLEGRGPKMVLMGYVDDATGMVYGRFYEYEGVIPAMDSMYRYIERYGIPETIYLDRHSTYKVNRAATIREELSGERALSQFERAMKELGVGVIHATSAPAKGRVENRFKTLQDRLIKELRLKGVSTIEGANKLLEWYLDVFNARFAKPAKKDVDLHRKCPEKSVLDGILCIKEERVLRKDSTVRYKNRIYLVTEPISCRVSRVMVEERLDGSIWIKHKDRYLKYREISIGDISKREEKRGSIRRKKRVYRPGKNHPWKRYNIFDSRRRRNYAIASV
jgi:transposase